MMDSVHTKTNNTEIKRVKPNPLSERQQHKYKLIFAICSELYMDSSVSLKLAIVLTYSKIDFVAICIVFRYSLTEGQGVCVTVIKDQVCIVVFSFETPDTQ